MLPSDAAAAHRARRSPGYLLRPLLQHVGLHDVPDVYTSVLHEYMALRKIDEIYTRPAYATAIFMASSHTPRTRPNAHHQKYLVDFPCRRYLKGNFASLDGKPPPRPICEI